MAIWLQEFSPRWQQFAPALPLPLDDASEHCEVSYFHDLYISKLVTEM